MDGEHVFGPTPYNGRYNALPSGRLIDTTELAAFLSVHPETIRRRIREQAWDRIPRPLDVPGHYRWTVESVSSWLASVGLSGDEVAVHKTARRVVGDE